MRIRLGTHGRVEVPAASALATILLLIAVAGCGARSHEQAADTSVSQVSQDGSSADTTMVASLEEPRPHMAQADKAGLVHQITLANRRCIRFEPQWTTVYVGQSVTWHSQLKRPLRIYVSPGVFDKMSFVVRPGATVNTGPARAVGQFSFWTEPCACRDMPLGVLLPGPGVRVRDAFYASAPGIH